MVNVTSGPVNAVAQSAWALRLAEALRSKFDSCSRPFGALGVVGALAILNAAVMFAMSWFENRSCGELPIRIIDLELTFSAHRFDTLLGLLERDECRAFVRWNFLTLDLLFPLFYALGLCAVFLWMERQRRFNANGTSIADPLPFRNHLFVVVPLAAGAFDVLVENIPLWLAATLLNHDWSADSPYIAALVGIGSLGAAIKWALVLMSAMAIVAELLSCSRGTVLRRLRFSAIAVVLGALPLLLVPQGQDILQRVVEGDRPGWRIAGALAALTVAALTVWYCGRKLVQLRFPADPDSDDANWYEFFARQIPRILGIAVLALGGAAFSRAGGALVLFATAGVGGYAVATVASKQWRALLSVVGKPFVRGSWKLIGELDEQIGRAIIASLLALVIIILAPLLLYGPPPRDFQLLRVTAWLLLVVAWAFYLYVYQRRGRIAARRAGKGTKYKFELLRVEAEAVSSIDAGVLQRAIRRGVLTGLALSVIAVAAFTIWPVETARTLGSLVILALAVSSVVFYGSIAAWVYGKYRIPAVPIAIAFAVLFSVWNENHAIRKLDTGRDIVAKRVDIATRLNQWRATDSSEAPSPVILVAASGGGLRAAYWTATSLAAIQNRNHAFNRHLFAISGVSGGSLGAAVYSAIVRDVERSDTRISCSVDRSANENTPMTFGPYHQCVRSFMSQDFLSPVLAKLVAPDFLQLFLPVPVQAFDRSLALEGSWEKSYYEMTKLQTMSDGFLALSQDSESGIPALFLNATHVETGKRYVTASLVRGDSTPPPGSSPRAMHDSRDLLDILQSDLPLSAAVHNSARFTYVSPPGRIQRGDSAEFGHLVDGGYFENSGLATLGEVLDVVRENRAGIGGRRPLLPIVLYLCNDPVPCRDGGAGDTIVTTKRAAVVEWAGPIRALLGTRDARGSLARAEIADVDGVHFIQLNVCESLLADDTTKREGAELLGSSERRQRAKERIVSPPLGWLLSKVARDWMDASLTVGAGVSRPSRCRQSNERAIQKIDSLLRLH